MSKWGSFSGVKIDALGDAITEILKDYGDEVFTATEEGLDTAESILVSALKADTPKKTGKFAKGWKGTKRKYRLRRYVGNSVTVKGSKGEDIALANILEYSTTREGLS